MVCSRRNCFNLRTISNQGDATSIVVDPSCNEVLKVWSDDLLVFDGGKDCRGQSRGMDLGANSETPTETLTWDLKDDEGNFVSSGDYTIEYFIAGEELSSSVSIHAQTPTNIPYGLEMYVTATSRTGVHYDVSPSLITVRIANTLDEILDLDFDDCRLVINDELYGDCGPDSIYGKEIVTIAQIPVNINLGQNDFSISLGYSTLSKELSIEGYEGEFQTNGQVTTPEIEVVLDTGQKTQYGNSEVFTSEIGIMNIGSSEHTVEFSNSCFGEIWIVDASGKVVMDSRDLKECTESNADYTIAPGEDKILAQRDWNFIDRDGCHVAPGQFTVLYEVPELGLFSVENVEYSGELGNYCLDSAAYIEPGLAGGDSLFISPNIHNVNNNEITFFSSCMLFTTLVGDGDVINDWGTHCENNQIYSTNADEIELDTRQFKVDYLENGEYSLIFETLSSPKVRTVVSFTWPITDNNTEEEQVSEGENDDPPRLVSGSWSSITNDIGTCWLLNTPESEIMTLAGSNGVVDWYPSIGIKGEYLIIDSETSPECAEFASQSFTIKEVNSEVSVVNDEDEEVIIVVETPVKSTEEQISPAVVTIGVAVASTGILSLLIAGIASNETLRIPATSAGLWLLGLVGRTSETSDGRYQRGRLMGYLTANPGCHFRALMAALEMSNGQITHHLKILEDEGRIWRRADGRLVRFYPYTSNLHPGVLDQDLPMPPLSPDPNSLQGKILRLLDDDGQMKQFPTQAELAHRLNRSQQLVSHHLRTLQKYGLVQKQKSGLKNRYCLTKEAIFLLETTDL